MSWIERLDNIEFTIRTGDGKFYKPLWKSGEKSKEFNTSKYDFINLEGSLIERRKNQSSVYPFTFWFQGEDNIEKSEEFEQSSNDNRLWTVEHPFYGTIKGQPTNIKRNDAKFNSTEITVTFWESIDGDFPEESISITNEVSSRVNSVNQLSLDFFVENSSPESSDLNNIRDTLSQSSSSFSPDKDSFNDFSNSVKSAVSAVDNIITDAENSFKLIQAVVNAPALFTTAVEARINSYVNSYESLKNSVSNLFSKYSFESQGASLISSICLACVNPVEGDFITRADIEEANNTLIEIYEDFLRTMDLAQVEVYDVEENWSPNVQIQIELSNLISFTSKSLFSLSFEAKQERVFELSEDSNLIILTHRFMSLDEKDKNIDTFRLINNIKNEELFKVRKGRTIKYFV